MGGGLIFFHERRPGRATAVAFCLALSLARLLLANKDSLLTELTEGEALEFIEGVEDLLTSDPHHGELLHAEGEALVAVLARLLASLMKAKP